MSFNKDCSTGNDLEEILILQSFLCLFIVQFNLNLLFKTLIKRFTSSKLKELVEITIQWDLLSKLPSSHIQ